MKWPAFINSLLILGLPICAAQDEVVSEFEAVPVTTAPAPNLTMAEAVSIATSDHPGLKAAQLQVQSEQHRVFQETLPPNPVFGYTASEVGNDGELGQQGLFYSQEFVRGQKQSLSAAVRQVDVQIARTQRAVDRLKIAAATRAAFIDAAYAQERLNLLTRLQQPLDNAVNVVEQLVNTGELGTSAALQSQLEASRNRLSISQMKVRLKVSRERLATIIGSQQLPENQRLASACLKPSGVDFDPESVWQQIIRQHPSLQLDELSQQKALRSVNREAAEPIPNLQTQWSLQQDAATNHTVFGIQLGVELPLNDPNTGNINAARSESFAASQRYQATQRSLRQKFVKVAGTIQEIRQQVQMIEDELSPMALRNLETTRKMFQLGEASYMDLLNSQRIYISQSLTTLDLLRDLARADARLKSLLIE